MNELQAILREIESRTCRSIGAGRDVTRIGAFLAAIHPTNDLVWLNFVVPSSDHADELTASDIDRLRDLFHSRGRRLRFEFFESLWPDLGGMLEARGLGLEHRLPLMLCKQGELRPCASAGVTVCELQAEADDTELAAFLATGKRGFGMEAAQVEPPEIAELREQLVKDVYRCAYGRIDGQMAGVGSLVRVNDELAGVATLPDFRRRGVAAMVSSYLLTKHFAAGRSYAWLSAGDDVASAVYAKVGFKTAAVQLTYVDAE